MYPVCRGGTCDDGLKCVKAGACQYKSSADELRAVLVKQQSSLLTDSIPSGPLKLVDQQEKVVEDFKGTVDGGGYKRSMDDPKKLPLSLIDPTFSEGVARVLQYGAKKYALGNWMRGMSWSQVIDAMRRHITALEKGEDADPETGIEHIYHVGCGAMFLARYMTDPRYVSFDDRMFKTPDA